MKAYYPESPLLQDAEDLLSISNIYEFNGMEFIYIPAGTLESKEGKINIESFYIQRTEMTQSLWKEIMGNNPANNVGDNKPIEYVTLNHVFELIKKLNKKEGNEVYRLPTKYEWEYACRAGSKSKYSFGNFITPIDKYAWYANNSDGETHIVSTKDPNSWGLYDMHGNVWEWCLESEKSRRDFQIIMGGSWNSGANEVTCDTQKGKSINSRFIDVGFRLVRLK